jgi:hypothetical protein
VLSEDTIAVDTVVLFAIVITVAAFCNDIIVTLICSAIVWFIKLQILSIGDRTNLVWNNSTMRPQRLQVLHLGMLSFRIMKWYFFAQTGCLLQPIKVEQMW